MLKTLGAQIKEKGFFPHSCFHDLRSAHGNDHPTDDGIDHR